MGAELGRISGPLLANNLLRRGVDLTFRNFDASPDILYLDVTNGRIGVNTSTPTRELTVNGTTTTTDLIVDTQASLGNLTLLTYRIQNALGSIVVSPNQTFNPTVVINELHSDNLVFANQTITTLTTNDNINLASNGTGKVVFNSSKVNVNGNLHATGDITWDGNITIGDSNTDSITFDADVTSDIIPATDNFYDLGSLSRNLTWGTAYVGTLEANSINLNSLTVNNINMLLTQSNLIYVSVNGSDTNYGNHQHSAFRTIKHALSAAQSGDTVLIFPGTYTEDFPLIVPQGVTVTGESLRNVKVIPSIGTQSNDGFLLNGESTVENITVANFYYNSVADTGYGFRFANNLTVTTRSPYLRNVTVITSAATLPAGKGALVDGSVANSSSKEASMLFHAVTMIVPDADGITATNGARIEWLNSFTYFANRGIYLTQGTLGRLAQVGATINLYVPNSDLLRTTANLESFFRVTKASWEASGLSIGAVLTNPAQFAPGTTITDVQGLYSDYGQDYYIIFTDTNPLVDLNANDTVTTAESGSLVFGAEMRSIGSANVYGNYGAVADGANTLGYLVGHNFGYIGTGTNSNNDANLSLQANEVVQINGGVIYFDSMDHKGDYRVGEIFYVNQQTGQVSFNAQSINFNATGNITINGPTGQIIIDATKVQVSNIRIHDNNIDSLTGPVNFSAQSGTTTLNTTVNVTGNTNITGDTLVKGNVFLGNSPLDLITITPNLTQDIIPGANNTYNLGNKTTPEVWNTAYFKTLNVDGITQITNNTISTLATNTDLKFQASGTGIVHVTGTDVQINNNLTVGNILTVNGLTTLQGTSITGTTTLVGDIGQTGNTYITGLFGNNNISITGASSYLAVPDIKIQNQTISATATDNNIQFVGNGTGGVTFDNKLKIVDNVISNIWANPTTNDQKSIYFTPNGTGNVVINSTTYLKVPYSNDSTKVLSVPGEIRQNSTTTAYEGYLSTGTESFTNVYSTDKTTYITPELTIGANDNILRFTVSNVVKGTIDSTKLFSANMQVGNFVFSNNTINNPVTNSDSIFNGAGSGLVNVNGLLFKDNNITNVQDSAITLVSSGTGYIKFGGTGAVVLPYGETSDRRLAPEQGETRYNSTLNYMEVYTGTTWIPAVGTLGAASLTDVLDIMDEFALILG